MYAVVLQSNKIKKAVVTNDKSATVPPKPEISKKNESVAQVPLYVFLILTLMTALVLSDFATSLYHTNFHLHFFSNCDTTERTQGNERKFNVDLMVNRNFLLTRKIYTYVKNIYSIIFFL